MKIFNKITNSYKNKIPFVAYRKPNDDTISVLFMNDESLFYVDDFSEKGFVFAPFDNQQKAILFPKETSEFILEALFFDTIEPSFAHLPQPHCFDSHQKLRIHNELQTLFRALPQTVSSK
mgnify:CR=1 FL=1